MDAKIKLRTSYKFVLRDKFGNIKDVRETHNLVTTVGLNNILDIYFENGTPATTWYLGLIAAGASLDASDTMSSHSGWTEETSYDESTRQSIVWNGAASSGSITNSSSPCVFTMNASVTVYGAFKCDDNTKSGTSGTLYGEAAFDGGSITADDDDTITVTVTCTATSN
jgi:hypothetical protein